MQSCYQDFFRQSIIIGWSVFFKGKIENTHKKFSAEKIYACKTLNTYLDIREGMGFLQVTGEEL